MAKPYEYIKITILPYMAAENLPALVGYQLFRMQADGSYNLVKVWTVRQ